MQQNDAFVAHLEAHKGILYKVANAYCRDREARDDLAQEIVVQLWRAFPRYDARFRFSTWMYRIAMNVAISFYRSERRGPRERVSIEEHGIDLAAADHVLTDAGDDVRLLHRLIGNLDALNRALVLLFLDGYANEEIAEIVGTTAGNVAVRLTRIKQRLRRDYERI